MLQFVNTKAKQKKKEKKKRGKRLNKIQNGAFYRKKRHHSKLNFSQFKSK